MIKICNFSNSPFPLIVHLWDPLPTGGLLERTDCTVHDAEVGTKPLLGLPQLHTFTTHCDWVWSCNGELCDARVYEYNQNKWLAFLLHDLEILSQCVCTLVWMLTVFYHHGNLVTVKGDISYWVFDYHWSWVTWTRMGGGDNRGCGSGE